MSLVFLLGGARSGKSQLAVELANQSQRGVIFVATAEAADDEMQTRIAQHRAQRPRHWQTVEAPLELVGALADAAAEQCVIVDCLSLWVANLLAAGAAETEIEPLAETAASAAAGRDSPTIAVSNEVGCGVVPATPLGRRYRDLLGRVNTAWAELADQTLLVVAGRALPLPPLPPASLTLLGESLGRRG
jgi:adenosyl cobinamide kinase/adenosyl cobinamide phosphate guanylyltransferase